MTTITRRSFLAASAASVIAAPAIGNIRGANNRVRIALSGAGGRGMGIATKEFGVLPDVEIVALVDPNDQRTQYGVGKIEKDFGYRPTAYRDTRKMLEDKNIDAVLVASCNHWHALTAIWALQAGKDVYVEKPCCFNVHEGRKLLEAIEKYKRVVQHGTQHRGNEGRARTVAAVRSGKYGKLLTARIFNHRARGPLGFKPITAPPDTLDWDLWIGPAAMTDYHANLTPYNWHWFWNTGNAEIGNNGPHYFDYCLWAMGERHPDSVISFGTRFVLDPENKYKDQAETPNIHFALYDFGGTALVYESCHPAGPKDKWPRREAVEFVTEDGIIRDGNFIAKDGTTEKINVTDHEKPARNHYANFIDAVRDPGGVTLNAPISKGFYAAAAPHFGNAAYRTGKPDSLASIREKMGDNPVMRESIESVLANVRNVFGDGVKVEKDIPWSVSEKSIIDTEKERFVDNAEANGYLTRVPRAPYAVPEEV